MWGCDPGRFERDHGHTGGEVDADPDQYDEAKWMESLKKRGSWLYEATQNAIKTNPIFMEADGE
jgi:hypothetical protein